MSLKIITYSDFLLIQTGSFLEVDGVSIHYHLLIHWATETISLACQYAYLALGLFIKYADGFRFPHQNSSRPLQLDLVLWFAGFRLHDVTGTEYVLNEYLLKK